MLGKKPTPHLERSFVVLKKVVFISTRYGYLTYKEAIDYNEAVKYLSKLNALNDFN